MKRYSISSAYTRNRKNGKIGFQYSGRTNDISEEITFYKECLDRWIENVKNENYEFRNQLNDFYGIRITDSQTKSVVYEDVHTSEEYGYKKVFEKVNTIYGFYFKGKFEKI